MCLNALCCIAINLYNYVIQASRYSELFKFFLSLLNSIDLLELIENVL